jgi:hypothetical protein
MASQVGYVWCVAISTVSSISISLPLLLTSISSFFQRPRPPLDNLQRQCVNHLHLPKRRTVSLVPNSFLKTTPGPTPFGARSLWARAPRMAESNRCHDDRDGERTRRWVRDGGSHKQYPTERCNDRDGTYQGGIPRQAWSAVDTDCEWWATEREDWKYWWFVSKEWIIIIGGEIRAIYSTSLWYRYCIL